MKHADSVPLAHNLLRQATDRLHRRIDRSSLLSALMRPEVTIQSYRVAMMALEQAYREIDIFLLGASGYCPAHVPTYLPRVPAIRRDLMELSATHDVSAGRQHRATPISLLKEPGSVAAYLGMRYVVEGAQLGSRLIHRHLSGVFGEDISRIGSFWIPGSTPKNTWPDLLAELAQVVSRDSLASATHAARHTFRHMALYLDAKVEVSS